jgi:hypothetical protein
MLEFLRLIREEEPPRPSTRLSSPDTLTQLAANRSTEAVKLTRLLRGEIDWIVMKALEKDRAQRYDTANALAADIQRYLADEPVLAGPPSAGYRLKKFVKRNKGRVVAATLLLVALSAGLAGTTWGLIRAAEANGQAQKRLEQVEKGVEILSSVFHDLDANFTDNRSREISLSKALTMLVALYEETGNHEEAARWRKELEKTKAAGKEPPGK